MVLCRYDSFGVFGLGVTLHPLYLTYNYIIIALLLFVKNNIR